MFNYQGDPENWGRYIKCFKCPVYKNNHRQNKWPHHCNSSFEIQITCLFTDVDMELKSPEKGEHIYLILANKIIFIYHMIQNLYQTAGVIHTLYSSYNYIYS